MYVVGIRLRVVLELDSEVFNFKGFFFVDLFNMLVWMVFLLLLKWFIYDVEGNDFIVSFFGFF